MTFSMTGKPDKNSFGVVEPLIWKHGLSLESKEESKSVEALVQTKQKGEGPSRK